MYSNFNDLKTKTMTGREYINQEKPNLVDNWSYPADLLSYGQVAEMLEAYHKAKLKLLGIANVVGQSEQLIAFSKWKEEKGYHPIYDHKGLVEEYLKSN